MVRIDTSFHDESHTTFFHLLILDTPQLAQFIEAHVVQGPFPDPSAGRPNCNSYSRAFITRGSKETMAGQRRGGMLCVRAVPPKTLPRTQ